MSWGQMDFSAFRSLRSSRTSFTTAPPGFWTYPWLAVFCPEWKSIIPGWSGHEDPAQGDQILLEKALMEKGEGLGKPEDEYVRCIAAAEG